MKKALAFTLLFAFGFIMSTKAQTYKYYTTDFSYKAKDAYGYWSRWSEWEETRCLVSISLDRNIINIYSDTPQEFDIYDVVGESEDSDGISFTVRCIDTDGLRCLVKIRRQNNGILQLYIEYNDLIYVYCLEERG